MTPEEIVTAGLKQLTKLKAIKVERRTGQVRVFKQNIIDYFAAAAADK
jgi:hypothetical protein